MWFQETTGLVKQMGKKSNPGNKYLDEQERNTLGEMQDGFSLFKMGNVSLDKRSEVLNNQTSLVIINWGRVYIATELGMSLVDRIYQKRIFQRMIYIQHWKCLVKTQCTSPNERMISKKLTLIETPQTYNSLKKYKKEQHFIWLPPNTWRRN